MTRQKRLDSLRVVTPCPVSWASMRGDDAVRFCDRCRKNVYNVASLGPAEAVALIERAEGRVCMLLTRRSDGTVVTGDCWAQLDRARKRGLVALAVAAPVIIAATLWSQAFGLRALFGILHRPPPPTVTAGAPPVTLGEGPPEPPAEHRLMGKMAAPRVKVQRRVARERFVTLGLTSAGIPRNDNGSGD